ncbi:hypothetical protein NOCA2210018 [metagenome]|uniref:Uncharacterized protein n=1 Tax=metagenome TaxID=256318 RepID=A0A2P2BY34_9ZZZZ
MPFEDADTLGRLEEDVLLRLHPPLNLKGMGRPHFGEESQSCESLTRESGEGSPAMIGTPRSSIGKP